MTTLIHLFAGHAAEGQRLYKLLSVRESILMTSMANGVQGKPWGSLSFDKHFYLLQTHWNCSLLCCGQGHMTITLSKNRGLYQEKGLRSCLIALLSLRHVKTKYIFIALDKHHFIITYTSRRQTFIKLY